MTLTPEEVHDHIENSDIGAFIISSDGICQHPKARAFRSEADSESLQRFLQVDHFTQCEPSQHCYAICLLVAHQCHASAERLAETLMATH